MTKKELRNMLLASVVLIVFIFVLVKSCQMPVEKEIQYYEDQAKKYNPYIGKTVVIDKDTVTIIGGSVNPYCEFELSNKLKVSCIFIENYFSN